MREHIKGRLGEMAEPGATPPAEPARKRRRAMGTLLLVLLAGAPGLRPSVAHAQDPKQDAKTRYFSGQSHYNLNEFQEALQDFKEAYRMYADPAFLFNIAQCERQLGDLEEAVRFYRNYLRNKPQAPNRREVEHKIEELRLLVEAKKTATQGAPQSVLPPAGDDVLMPVPLSASHAPAPAPVETAPPPAVVAPVIAPVATRPAPVVTPAPAVPPAAPKLALAQDPALSATSTSTSSSSSQGVDLRAQPGPAAEAPIYQRWWFWAGAAGVVAVGVVAAVVLSSGGSAGAPSSGLGNQKVF